MREIPLTRGKVALVDEADYERLVAMGKWYAAARDQTFYACRKNNTEGMVYMHRAVVDAAPDVEVDHEDNDGLNNQRGNLRVTTPQQNKINTRALSPGKTSRFKGVHRRSNGAWVMQIKTPSRRITATYPSEQAAAAAYNILAREHFGEFARLNEVPA